MFSKVLEKVVLAVFLLGVVAIGSGICADASKKDAKKADLRAELAPLGATRFAKEIGLSDAQVESIKAIQKESREGMKSVMDLRKSNKEALELVKKSSDTVAIKEARSEIKDTSMQLMEMRKAEAGKIAAVLTAEQKTKLVELSGAAIQERIEKMKATKEAKKAADVKK